VLHSNTHKGVIIVAVFSAKEDFYEAWFIVSIST
jgi:hypothetical protein